MNETIEPLTPESARKQNGGPGERPCRLGGLIAATAALLLGFSVPLYHLMRFAVHSDLYSHIILIPFISLYLIWLKRRTLPPPSAPARSWAPLPLIAGLASLACFGVLALSGSKLETEDSLALSTLSFLLLLSGVACLFLSKETLRAIAFPLGFLLFMVPFPIYLQDAMVTFLQHGSAAMAYVFLRIAGTPVFNQGLVFTLPGITLEVAPACSGIHSSLALFITSLLAGHFFLRTPWKCAALALAVIPLALLRNGFRVFTIGELCVHIGPEMIYSPLHRQGGPLFFILSLIPFFLLLLFLMKSDRRARSAPRANQ